MHFDSPRLGTLILLLILCTVSEIESATYRDCTEQIKGYVFGKNNGTLQFEYTHYAGFWLSQSLEDNEKLLLQEPNVLTKREHDLEEGTSFLTILDSETYANLANVTNRYVGYLWSWRIIGCGHGFVCISTSDPSQNNHFLTTRVDYLNYYYYPTIDHNFPLLLKPVTNLEDISTKPEFKWKFKCMDCTMMQNCQVLLKQKSRSGKENSRNEFKIYSTTKYGRVHLSNIKLSDEQTSKYHWNIHSLPTQFHEKSDDPVIFPAMDDNTGDTSIPSCAPTTTDFNPVNRTIKSAAYFALFGLLGFSIVWLLLIICLVYDYIWPY